MLRVFPGGSTMDPLPARNLSATLPDEWEIVRGGRKDMAARKIGFQGTEQHNAIAEQRAELRRQAEAREIEVKSKGYDPCMSARAHFQWLSQAADIFRACKNRKATKEIEALSQENRPTTIYDQLQDIRTVMTWLSV